MKTQSIQKYRPVGISRLLGGPGAKYFKKADLDRLIALIPEGSRALTGDIMEKMDDGEGGLSLQKVSRTSAFPKRLETAATVYQVLCERQQMPTPQVFAERYEAIEAAATALLKTLGVSGKKVSSIPQAIWDDLASTLEPRSDHQSIPSGQVDHAAILELAEVGAEKAAALSSTVTGVERLLKSAALAKKRALAAGGSRPRHSADEARKEFVRCLCSLWVVVIGRTDTDKKPFRLFVSAAAEVIGLRFQSDRALSELILSVRKS